MKRNLLFLVPVLLLLLVLIASCGDDYGPSSSKGDKFLVGCVGNASEGLEAGLYTMENSKTGPVFDLVTKYRPTYYSMDYVSHNNGRIAFSVERSLLKEGESGIAYMDVKSIDVVKMVPIPPATEDYWYGVQNERPVVLDDGRIAYRVTLNTDNPYDDYHIGQLAIYDPKSGDIELSGDPSGFVLGQPEKGGDTEGGSMGSSFAISPDSRYAYCSVYGYGTDWGVFHIDYWFIVRYTIGDPLNYKRIAQAQGHISAVTGDGDYLIFSGNGLQRVTLSTNLVEKVDDYTNTFNPGQVSASSSKMFKIWRGSGMGIFDMDLAPVWQYAIINGANMTGSYRGLGHGGQFSDDEQKIFFTASSDFYTNYATPLVIFSTPIMENNTAPDSITTMPADYCTGVFLLLED